MKKSERIVYTIFKVVYAISMIAAVVTYVSDLISPTATFCRVTSSDWLTLGIMSCVFVLITESEKKAKALSVHEN